MIFKCSRYQIRDLSICYLWNTVLLALSTISAAHHFPYWCPTVFRKLRIGGPSHFNLRKMTSKTRLSELHTDASQKLKKSVTKGCSADSYVGIEEYKSDPNRLQSLTAKELQTMARTLGISARGNKSQLISALKSSFNTGNANNSSLSVESVEAVDLKSMPSKRKTKSLFTTQDSSNVLNVSEKKQKRGVSVKESAVCTIEDNDTLLVATQKLKLSSGETVVERKNSRSTKKVVTKSKESEVVVSLISNEPWSVLAHKKPQKDWVPYNPITMRPPPLTRDKQFIKLMSWNVNGLRALLKLESFSALELAQKEDFDVLCLQETKIQEKDVEDIKNHLIEGYDHSFWTCSVAKLGYSGTAIISRVKPISVKYGLGMPDHDTEGRLVTMEFDNFFLLCAYVPNSGDGLKRLTYRVNEWDRSLSNYMKELEKSKPVILTGDLNCAHQEIDIFNPAGNLRSAGFTVEERESFERNYLSNGFVDTFRIQHPNAVGYTYWGYRHNGRKTNKGWRLDYFLASECIADKVHDSYILPQVTGSDHCPIGLVLKL